MKKYEIWDARVRFEGTTEVKVRPVMIWNDSAFIIAYKMTGTDRGDNAREFKIEHWKEAGLDKPTSIRISKILRFEKHDMVQKRGELDQRDRLRFEMRLAAWR